MDILNIIDKKSKCLQLLYFMNTTTHDDTASDCITIIWQTIDGEMIHEEICNRDWQDELIWSITRKLEYAQTYPKGEATIIGKHMMINDRLVPLDRINGYTMLRN